jgi:predicted lipoprotein with Yx(FWY)xxD motif
MIKGKMVRRMLAVFMITGMVLAGTAQGQSLTVQVAKKEGLGAFITDAKGMTLYIFKKDMPGRSFCAGPCVEKWPVFYSESITPPIGLKADDFGTITGDDGRKQTTYKGLPLYYFLGDKNPGDANGQGLNDVWYVAAP